MNPKIFAVLFVLLLFPATALAVVEESSMQVFAVTTEGQGLSAELNLKIIPGSGKIWSSVDPVVGTSTQNSEKVALELAKSYAKNVSSHDYLFEIKSDAAVVEGPSAGSAMALMLVSALNDRRLPPDVGITGTISENGVVGHVGGIFKKAQEAARIGLKLFMIPKGESKQVIKEAGKVESVSLPEYALSEWGLKVVEVSNLDGAYALAFTDIESIDINRQEAERLPLFVPKPIQYAEELQPLKEFSEKYVSETTQLAASAKTSLGTTLISDNSVINDFLAMVGETEELVERAQTLLEKNYLYSSANDAFLARVNAMLVKDVSENPSLLAENSTLFEQKTSALEQKIEALEKELGKEVPTDFLEWHASSQERLLWARITLESISSAEPEAFSMIEKLEQYEHALAWAGIAEEFYGFGKHSEKKVLPNSILSEESDEAVVEAENTFTTAPIKVQVDDGITRRLDSARLGQKMEWFLGSLFDSHSALYLVKGHKELEKIGTEQLRQSLEQKISILSEKISLSGHSAVWANLYLDHAKYYLNAADFYAGTGQGAKATEMLESGFRVALLAEGNLEASDKAFAAFSGFGETDYVKAPKASGEGLAATIKIEPEEQNIFYFILMALLYVAIILVIVLVVFIIYSLYYRHPTAKSLKAKKAEHAKTIGAINAMHFHLVSSDKKFRELKRLYSAGKISEAELRQQLARARQYFSAALKLFPAQQAASQRPKHPKKRAQKKRK